jgi:hypothetical protein
MGLALQRKKFDLNFIIYVYDDDELELAGMVDSLNQLRSPWTVDLGGE